MTIAVVRVQVPPRVHKTPVNINCSQGFFVIFASALAFVELNFNLHLCKLLIDYCLLL